MRVSSSPIEAKPDSSAPDSLFTFVLVKPTHYDDDGYPIQWFRSALPSNTLACMNSLAEDASKREVLGPGVRIEVDTYDETNRRVFPSRIIRDLKRRGGRALIGIVGVQSNQFPRAVDIARYPHPTARTITGKAADGVNDTLVILADGRARTGDRAVGANEAQPAATTSTCTVAVTSGCRRTCRSTPPSSFSGSSSASLRRSISAPVWACTASAMSLAVTEPKRRPSPPARASIVIVRPSNWAARACAPSRSRRSRASRLRQYGDRR